LWLIWRFWAIWWQSPESTVLAGSELKLGIDLFAGKSEITEGCSDLREIGDSSDCRESAMCGCQRATGAMLLVRRKAERCGKAGCCGTAKSGTAVRRNCGCCGTSVLRRSVGLDFFFDSTSVRLPDQNPPGGATPC
jgi:hypothetical protein